MNRPRSSAGRVLPTAVAAEVDRTVVLGLELDGWDVADAAVQPVLVEPGHPGEGGQLEVLDAAQGAFVAHELGLVEPGQALGLRVVLGVPALPMEARAPAAARRWA